MKYNKNIYILPNLVNISITKITLSASKYPLVKGLAAYLYDIPCSLLNCCCQYLYKDSALKHVLNLYCLSLIALTDTNKFEL